MRINRRYADCSSCQQQRQRLPNWRTSNEAAAFVHHHSRCCLLTASSSGSFSSSSSSLNESPRTFHNDNHDDDDDYFLRQELARLESFIDDDDDVISDEQQRITLDDNTNDDDDDDMFLLNSLLLQDEEDDVNEEDLDELERSLQFLGWDLQPLPQQQQTTTSTTESLLEQALQEGMVLPANANVGSGGLAGDFGFDPLHLSEKDYIGTIQRFVIDNLVPGGDDNDCHYDDGDGTCKERATATDMTTQTTRTMPRPSALVLRDYREAEIRHGRLAMLAAFFWPLQEMLDRFVLDDFGSVMGNLLWPYGGSGGDGIDNAATGNGGMTLPYIPLIMTAIMLLLGYLDIYSKAIKDMDRVGEAFSPGDCFWDPLKILEGGSDRMKRNMQERELFNGRMAMLAIAIYTWEEVITKQPIISVPGNELLFEPAYQIPYIQEWLDSQFG